MWPFLVDKYFFCIHFFFDNKTLLKVPKIKDFTQEEIKSIVTKTDVNIGILCKKSISGRKSYLKSLGD